MSDADESPPESGEIPGLPWQAEKRIIKDAAYYANLKSKYEEFVKETNS